MASQLHAKLLEHLQSVLDSAAVPKTTLSASGLLLILVSLVALSGEEIVGVFAVEELKPEAVSMPEEAGGSAIDKVTACEPG